MKEMFDSEIDTMMNNVKNFPSVTLEIKKDVLTDEQLKAIKKLKQYFKKRKIESSRTRYTISATIDKIKKVLASVRLDVNKYSKEIEKHKQYNPLNQHHYDYDLGLDFSDNPKIPFDIDDREYYYKAYHFQKLGLFKKNDAPCFKVKLSHLSPDIIYALSIMDVIDRKFVLKQAVSRIFEDINFELYHDSISSKLEVILVK